MTSTQKGRFMITEYATSDEHRHEDDEHKSIIVNSSAEIHNLEERKITPLISTSPKNVDRSTITDENNENHAVDNTAQDEESVPLQILRSF